MTAVYDKLGINFMYPENWKLLDDSQSEPHVVTLESPDGSSTWSVHVYSRHHDPNELMKETIGALQETYPDVEISPLTAQGELEDALLDRLQALAGVESDSVQGIEAMFYCLDFLIQARLFLVGTPRHWLLFWTQAEDRDFENQQMVFTAMSFSLLQNLDAE